MSDTKKSVTQKSVNQKSVTQKSGTEKFVNVQEGVHRLIVVPETSPEARRRAVRALASRARDAQDARALLDALGLRAVDGQAARVLAAARSRAEG